MEPLWGHGKQPTAPAPRPARSSPRSRAETRKRPVRKRAGTAVTQELRNETRNHGFPHRRLGNLGLSAKAAGEEHARSPSLGGRAAAPRPSSASSSPRRRRRSCGADRLGGPGARAPRLGGGAWGRGREGRRAAIALRLGVTAGGWGPSGLGKRPRS